jgi:hypothetical protein
MEAVRRSPSTSCATDDGVGNTSRAGSTVQEIVMVDMVSGLEDLKERTKPAVP